MVHKRIRNERLIITIVFWPFLILINLYNNKRPHLSLNYKTPAEAHLETGEQKRVWKNYYKGNKPEEVENVINELTSGCRISAAY